MTEKTEEMKFNFETAEERFNKLIVYAIATVISIIVLTLGSCTMHSNTYDEVRLHEEGIAYVVKVEAEAAVTRMEIESDAARTESIKSLIDSGISPIAARCAVEGWKKDEQTCMTIGLAAGAKTNVQ